MEPGSYDQTRYLAAKRSVDDRALNRAVLEVFRAQVGEQAGRPLRVLELGAGLGSMVSRLWELGIVRRAQYTLLERDGERAREAAQRLHAWAAGVGRATEAAGRLRVEAQAGELDLTLIETDVFAYLRECPPHGFDLVVAHAVLDLLDVPSLLPLLWRALVPSGLAWLTINFDGETILLPELARDREVLEFYHRSMDARAHGAPPGTHSWTGRRLLLQLPASGGTVLAAGSSDWVVWPVDGRYPHDERYFLHHIVHTIDGELRTQQAIDAAAVDAWVRARHAQIAAGELVYIAHQIDVLGRAPGKTDRPPP